MTTEHASLAVPLLDARGIRKHFGGVQALRGVDLSVTSGEVHGLLGENGSGKSTLIKILSGFHAPDTGSLEMRGKHVPLPLRAGRFRELGMAFVHQDLGLIPSLSVLENLRMGDFAATRGRAWINWRSESRHAKATFERFGVRLQPSAMVADLAPIQRALLAIVRAVDSVANEGRSSYLLVLDEPTVFLPKRDIDELFAVVEGIRNGGGSVLFVSHDLDEVAEITDRVTVFRSGENVGTAVTAQVSKADLVDMIIGKRPEVVARSERAPVDGPSVSIQRMDTPGLRGELSFTLRAGEVLGVTGLVGSGFEYIPYAIFGAQQATGVLTVGEERVRLEQVTPSRALTLGVALVPGDRQRQGAVGSLSIADNVTLRILSRFFRRGFLHRREMLRSAKALSTRFDIRPNQPRLRYSALSGGNQQRAVLAKWLQTTPKLLLLHEPTQGVDVGARQQIFGLIRDAANGGTCVLCASSDYEQLAEICGRVLVFRRGAIATELDGMAVTKDEITKAALAAS